MSGMSEGFPSERAIEAAVMAFNRVYPGGGNRVPAVTAALIAAHAALGEQGGDL